MWPAPKCAATMARVTGVNSRAEVGRAGAGPNNARGAPLKAAYCALCEAICSLRWQMRAGPRWGRPSGSEPGRGRLELPFRVWVDFNPWLVLSHPLNSELGRAKGSGRSRVSSRSAPGGLCDPGQAPVPL